MTQFNCTKPKLTTALDRNKQVTYTAITLPFSKKMSPTITFSMKLLIRFDLVRFSRFLKAMEEVFRRFDVKFASLGDIVCSDRKTSVIKKWRVALIFWYVVVAINVMIHFSKSRHFLISIKDKITS